MAANESKELIEAVWQKGLSVKNYDSDLIRKDCCGAWILKSEFGNRGSAFGWEIDHIYPQSMGGNDNIDNLRPMQWQNNVSKGNNYPSYISHVTSSGSQNIESETNFIVNNKVQNKIKELYGVK